MNSRPIKMVLGTSQVLATAPVEEKLPTPAKKTSKPTKPVKVDPGIKNPEAANEFHAAVQHLPGPDRKRAMVLQERYQTPIQLSPELMPIHERCRTRNEEIFGTLHYGELLHVGISKIRGLTPNERLALVRECTVPHTKPKPTPLIIKKGCWLDWQFLYLQVREELWISGSDQRFGMTELIRMVDAVTKDIPDREIRGEYVRISLRRG